MPDADVPESAEQRRPNTTAAVVLAAGLGSRYDGETHKLLAPFRGKPLVRWALEAAMGAGLDAVYVVTGAVDTTGAVPDGVVVVENHSFADGQPTSLSVAIAVARGDRHQAIVVGLGDMPLVPSSAWRAVADAPGPLVTATFSRRRSPPVKVAEEMWSLLPLSGDEGARSLMRMGPDVVTEVACEGELIDIDTRGDLSRWT
ncbi:MAG: NTP transferase domain-containing protein [Acidimicrobiales bacterium]